MIYKYIFLLLCFSFNLRIESASIESLPLEVKMKIMSELEIEDYISIRSINKLFNQISENSLSNACICLKELLKIEKLSKQESDIDLNNIIDSCRILKYLHQLDSRGFNVKIASTNLIRKVSKYRFSPSFYLLGGLGAMKFLSNKYDIDKKNIFKSRKQSIISSISRDPIIKTLLFISPSIIFIIVFLYEMYINEGKLIAGLENMSKYDHNIMNSNIEQQYKIGLCLLDKDPCKLHIHKNITDTFFDIIYGDNCESYLNLLKNQYLINPSNFKPIQYIYSNLYLYEIVNQNTLSGIDTIIRSTDRECLRNKHITESYFYFGFAISIIACFYIITIFESNNKNKKSKKISLI